MAADPPTPRADTRCVCKRADDRRDETTVVELGQVGDEPRVEAASAELDAVGLVGRAAKSGSVPMSVPSEPTHGCAAARRSRKGHVVSPAEPLAASIFNRSRRESMYDMSTGYSKARSAQNSVSPSPARRQITVHGGGRLSLRLQRLFQAEERPSVGGWRVRSSR